MEATICQEQFSTDMADMEEGINSALNETNYYFNRCGLWLDTDKGSQKISDFVIIPQSNITKEFGTSAERFVEVLGYTASGNYLSPVVLEVGQYESMNWIAQKWGLSVTVELPRQKNLAHIWRVSQELGKEYATNTIVYTHMGWRHIGNSWCYLHSGGVVGDEEAQVELQDVAGYGFPDHTENYQEAIRASLRLKDVAPAKISVPLLALVYLSPLNEFFRQAGHEPAFVTSLTGPTGTMKSTLAALALCHFGQFTGTSLPGKFKDTAYALEMKGFSLRDTLMVVDDFYPSARKSEYGQMTSTLQWLLRSYGDRSGRARMTADIKLREVYVPRGNLLVTGEDNPNLEQSGQARQFLLEINPGDVDKEQLSSLQKDSALLGLAMRGYIEWLIPQADALKDVLLEKFTVYRQQVQGGHPRLAEVVAWLKIGYEMFLDYAISRDVVFGDSKQIMLEEAVGIFMELASRQTAAMKNDTPVFQFLSALNEMLASDQCHCIKLDDEGSVCGGLKGRGFIGYVDSTCYYLHPDTVMAAVIDFYKRRGVHFSITKTMLLKQLASAGAIRESRTGERVNRTPVKRIGGKNQRFIHLKREALDKLNTPDER